MSVDLKHIRKLAAELDDPDTQLVRVSSAGHYLRALADEVERLEVRLDAAAFEQAEIWRTEREEVWKPLLKAARRAARILHHSEGVAATIEEEIEAHGYLREGIANAERWETNER